MCTIMQSIEKYKKANKILSFLKYYNSTSIFVIGIVTIMLNNLGCGKYGDHMPLSESKATTLDNSPQKNENIKDCLPKLTFEVGYRENILPIFKNYCKECHSQAPFNWMDYSVVKTKKDKFYFRLFDLKNMPPAIRPQPTNQEFDLIKKWLSLDLPESQYQAPDSCTPIETPPPQNTPTPFPLPLPLPTFEPSESPMPLPTATVLPTETPIPTFKPEPSPSTPLPIPTPSITPILTPDPTPVTPEITFNYTIKPLVKKYCFACHNWGDLNWIEYPKIKIRVDNGKLFERLILKRDMPMEGFPKPTEVEIQVFQKWIENGGPE